MLFLSCYKNIVISLYCPYIGSWEFPMDFSGESKVKARRVDALPWVRKEIHPRSTNRWPPWKFFQRDFHVFFCCFFLQVFWKKRGGCLGWALFCVACYIIKDQKMYVLGCNTKVPKTFNFNVVRLMDKNHAPPGCIHETSWNMRQFCIQCRWRIFVHCTGWWWPTILISQRPMLIVPTKFIQKLYTNVYIYILHPYYL